MGRRIKYVDDERITVHGLLHDAHGRLEQSLARTVGAKVGITRAVHDVLLRLARSPDQRLRVTELAEQLCVTTGGATRLVNRVVDLGFAVKAPSTQDRRVQWVQLTPVGRRVVERATRLHLQHLQRELFDRLSADELAVLRRLCARLVEPDDPTPPERSRRR